ncbi:MAG: saccharopine dehydrogenase NADP-binding domain-containing protein [Propionibacteriales bacterium]|nr:saccharopine dehydrogenase NADP-binding domain-containing protein [Propionibacteriales bacterium]
MPADAREFDVVVFGATGFTGQLLADYLARSAPVELRWAVAGRNTGRLTSVRDRLAVEHPGVPAPGVVSADAADPVSLASLAQRTRVVATTVGPFAKYGEGLVQACVNHGTDYADITGEPEFVDRMWLLYHRRAIETGARIVHSCGFESIPPDLGAWWTLRHLPSEAPVQMTGYVRARGGVSAGTFHSAVGGFARARHQRDVAAERKRAERRPGDRRTSSTSLRPHREPLSGRWSVPLPTIDPVVVRRSAAACPEYGPDFRYGHFAVVGTLPAVAGCVAGAGALRTFAPIPPVRAALSRLAKAGEGPSPRRRAASWFRVRFVATSGADTVVTEVSGGDPGYDETAKMLGESALCLALDDLPERSGQLTTVQAMGPSLLDRLVRAGITFRIVDSHQNGKARWNG